MSLALPSGTAANDQILLTVTLPGNQSIKSTPSGYTLVGTYSSGTGASNVQLAVYRRTAQTGDSSITITFSKTFAKSATVVVYRGVNPAAPIDVNTGAPPTVSGTTITSPSLTTTKAGDELVFVDGAESSTAGTWNAPPTMATAQDNPAGAPTIAASIADQTLTSAGATGTRTATYSITGSLAAAVIALQPAQTTFTYDAIGDRKTSTTPSGATSLSYDQLGRMTAYNSTTYAYNGDGLRTSTTTGRNTESFTWQPQGNPAILVDGSTDYIYGPDGLPLEQISGSTVLYYLHDALGSTRVLTTSTGTITATSTYGAYGNLVASTGTATNPFGYAGYYTDPTGLTYNVGRYYDPAVGQFISVDPLVDLTGEDYRYAGGDPIINADPSGLWCWNPAKVNCWTSDISTVAGSASAIVSLVPGLEPEAAALATFAFASDLIGCVTSECDYPGLVLDAVAIVPGAAAIYFSDRVEGYAIVEKLLVGVLHYDPWLDRVSYFEGFLVYVEKTRNVLAEQRAATSGQIAAALSGVGVAHSLAGGRGQPGLATQNC